jgi:hypothetical protein
MVYLPDVLPQASQDAPADRQEQTQTIPRDLLFGGALLWYILGDTKLST